MLQAESHENRSCIQSGVASIRIPQQLGRISRLARQRPLTGPEEKRLAADLERVYQRLDKREYRETDFCGNTFNVPERTREFFTYLNSYFENARTWARVLDALNLRNFPSVIDICPGWSPKIELALYYLGYTGETVLVDQNQAALSEVERFMQLFGPAYRLSKCSLDLFEQHTLRGGLVLANHVIDDLALSYFAPRYGYSAAEIYLREEAMRAAWAAVLSDAEANLQEAAPRIAAAVGLIVAPAGTLVLTQYKAYMERLLDLDGGVQFSCRLLRAVAALLTAGDFKLQTALVKGCLEHFDGYFDADECFVLSRSGAEVLRRE